MKQQVAIINWHDSVMSDGMQVSRQKGIDYYKPVLGVSVGLVVNNNKDFISIATDWFYKDDQFRQISVYPKSAIDKLQLKDLMMESEKK
ncbi:MAG TPA: hypothetical protein PKL88_03265 [bacterium]|nr:hypothetical protein [bacterium]